MTTDKDPVVEDATNAETDVATAVAESEVAAVNTAADTLTPEQVAQWLQGHPEFFAEQTELLQTLTIPHGDGVTSLVQKQVEVLRQNNERLNQLLTQISETARANLRASESLLDMGIETMRADDLESAVRVIRRCLKRDFQLVNVEVMLLDYEANTMRTVASSATELKLFKEGLDNHEPRCGHLSPSELQWFFGRHAEEVKSSAIVGLGQERLVGILAMASDDPDYFTPAKGTELLKRLGEVLGEVLREWLH